MDSGEATWAFTFHSFGPLYNRVIHRAIRSADTGASISDKTSPSSRYDIYFENSET
ncbi:hypothetical protein CGLAU_11525 [Corynebacterium glaucum]|uniref:Uncharacterized protein n=1 Tax=Corynebacterium glaucum TaxID=187491 RepID=A0A1Q2HZE4_9CORY|nr:hypothetical protein CGLAU_11525 [Corynebacterium glaucum]